MAVYNEQNKKKWTKDGRHWYYVVYYKDFSGKRLQKRSKMYESKDEAEEAEALFILQKNNPSKKKFIIVADAFFMDYKKRKKESSYESYLYAYNKHIRPYFNDYYITDIDISEIRNWKEHMETKHYKVNYLNKVYNAFKNIFDFAIKNYGIPSNPVSVLGPFENKQKNVIADTEKLRYITLNDFNKFVSVIDESLWKTFFIFLFYTGCRKGEVLALRWKDIDFDENVININKTLYYKHKDGKDTTTKNGKNRKIKISKLLREQLIIYKKETMNYIDYSDNWFVFGNSRFLAPATIDRKKNEYFDKAELPPITIHEFRHSHVSLLINEYIKTNQSDTTKFFLMMSDRLGHTIEVMQKTYMHLFPSVQDDIVNLLDNL